MRNNAPIRVGTRPDSTLARLLAGVHDRAPGAVNLGPLPAEAPSPGEPGHPEYHQKARRDFALKRWAVATPRRYRTATAAHPDVRAWVQQASDHFAHPGLSTEDDAAVDDAPILRSLLLTGPTGTGKTHNAYGALRGIAETGPRRRYALIATTTADMYGELRPTGQIGAAEARLKQLTDIPLLLLDDLGSAKTSEWTEEVTYRLINERYNACRPTLFTSNLPTSARDEQGRPLAPDLIATLGDRIVSRLAEMTTVIDLTGADRRRTGAAA